MKRLSRFPGAALLLTLAACSGSSTESRSARRHRSFRLHSREVLAEIQGMLVRDQAIRNIRIYGTADTAAIDSMTQLFARSGTDLDSLLLLLRPAYGAASWSQLCPIRSPCM